MNKQKKLNLVFIGRLEKENEVEKYAELVRELQSSKLKLQMTWVGDGAWRDECEAIGRVTGFVSDQKKIATYIKKADLVFASSYLSILQAQVVGKVVCAFYSHDLKRRYLETYSGAKYMFISNDIILMKEQILDILSNKEKRSMMERKARSFAIEKTWEKVVEKYERLWLS